MVSITFSGVIFAQKPPEYDKNGRLITDFDQVRRDRESGILQRGGFNPEIAARAARERQKAARYNGVPKLGNSNESANPNMLSEHNVYVCQKGNTKVFVDSEGRKKCNNCHLVRQGKSEAVDNPEVRIVPLPEEALKAAQEAAEKEQQENKEMAATTESTQETTQETTKEGAQESSDEKVSQEILPCSGAILYKGSTYIFNENEPCPMPEDVFKNRRPIEAEPTYYTN